MIDGKIIRGGMKMKKWKLATIAGTLLISFTLGSMAVLADTNVVTEQDGVKVFVGAVSQNHAFTRNSFIDGRTEFIMENGAENPQTQETALITFNQYMTTEAVDSFVDTLGNCEVKQIFLGIPNVDGRTIIGKAGTGTVSERVAENFDGMIEEEQDDDMKQELLNYKNNSQIFAITIETTNATIAEATQRDIVDFVDVYNYPNAEQKAQRENVPVSYVAVPEKPDNSN